MNKKRATLAIGLIIIILIGSITINYFYSKNNTNNNNNGNNNNGNHNSTINNNSLETDINNGLSIMYFEPHPDDEVYSPGIFPYASSKGCKMWVVALVTVDDVPEQAREARREAIAWFEENYLEEYIVLGMKRGTDYRGHWHNWEWDNETIKAKYKEIIEEKQPDILMTFSPYGSCDMIEHGLISNTITDIWDELTYEPKPRIYWFINMDEGPRNGICEEYKVYPPTDIIDLNNYSNILGKTYWEAKIEFWTKYSESVGPLKNFITQESQDKNDKKEYFMRYI